MATDKTQGTKIAKWADRDMVSGTRMDTATFIGVVKNNVDPTRSGRLQVWIPDFGGSQTEGTNQNNPVFWRTVSYASPFFGTTYIPQANDSNTFNNTNQTYGMWFVPPDIGNQVLCTFVNGDPDRGFWFACINPTLSHYMVPAVAASKKINRVAEANPGIAGSLLPEDHIPPQRLPVTEFNENAPGAVNDTFINNEKPIHEFQANVLFRQGLDRDKIRGAISSSSQRETPSKVFGISTPGRPFGNDPADDPDFQRKLEAGEISQADYAVSTRKGGHTFVMDDGDMLGNDELLRLRTAGGHQLLMNDTEKVIYLANSSGSVWMEFAESGHVHLYAAGGYNLHTEGDFNVHAGGSINMDAGGSVNLNASSDVSATASRVNLSGTTSALLFGGRVSIGTDSSLTIGSSTIAVTASGAITIDGSSLDLNSAGGGSSSVTGVQLQKNSHSDTGYDDVTGLWFERPGAATSITTVMPQHEPWTRQGLVQVLGAAPFKTVEDSVCPPKFGNSNSDYTLPSPNGNTRDRGQFRGQPAPWTTDTAFQDKVKSICVTLNVNYIDMLAVMNLESARTFDPYIRNSLGYTGLIQFGRAAATTLGTTTDFLRQLSRVDQCDWVLKYFQYWKQVKGMGSLRLVDMYLTVLWPAGVGRPNEFVIFPRGSAPYRANSGFDKQKLGFVTVGMVEDSIQIHLLEVKQALANAGAVSVPPETPVDVSDGAGTTVKTTSVSNTAADNTDQGITKAVGVSISNTCPGEFLSREDAYSPPAGIGDSPALDVTHAKAMMAELGHFESRWVYDLQNGKYIGKFQVDAAYLAARGFIKPDAVTQYGDAAVDNSASWTGRGGITGKDAYFSYRSVQDETQYTEFRDNFTALKASGGILETDDLCTAAGMLFVAHQFRSTALALEWRKKGELIDDRGVSGAVYFNHGRYAIDVLSAQGAVTGTAGTGGPNTTGIDPDDVFIFQPSGTGTRANFDQLTTEFKSQILPAAQEYKQKTNSKITVSSAFRSQEAQTLLYERWIAAGGNMATRPTAGGITTPARTVGSHSGYAIDSPQAQVWKNTVDFSKYGLFWGGEFRTPDRVHVQSKNRPQATEATASPQLTGQGGVVAIGDSIAAGAGAALKKYQNTVTVNASASYTTQQIIDIHLPRSKGAAVAVVSAGGNDILVLDATTHSAVSQRDLTDRLRTLRNQLGAKRVIWILPQFVLARQVVEAVAASYNDTAVTFTPAGDGFHPANYATLAQQLNSLIGTL